MPNRRPLIAFALAELVLALAIPLVVIEGYRTLLTSRAGTFVEEPGRSDPGWIALVDPTTVVGVVEVDGERVTGLALVVHNPQAASTGGVILVPGNLELAGVLLDQLAPSESVAALSGALNLGVEQLAVLDGDGWQAFLQAASYELENPDPVPGSAGTVLAVGPVEVGAELASAFVGRPAPDAGPASVLPRRQLFWTAVLADPPVTTHLLAQELASLDRQASQVFTLPVSQLEPVAVLDPVESEELIRQLVAFPTGAVPGSRSQIRIVDRTGAADLEGVAAAVAARGLEVVEIGNAAVFDQGPTELVVPIALAATDSSVPDDLTDLASALGLGGMVVDQQALEGDLFTLIVGDDFDPGRLG